MTHTSQTLDGILARTRCLLIDFGGPICGICAGLTDVAVAGRLPRSSPARASTCPPASAAPTSQSPSSTTRDLTSTRSSPASAVPAAASPSSARTASEPSAPTSPITVWPTGRPISARGWLLLVVAGRLRRVRCHLGPLPQHAAAARRRRSGRAGTTCLAYRRCGPDRPGRPGRIRPWSAPSGTQCSRGRWQP